tara:strand:- start:3251 stop:3487 length:237 start_codon:yes stop_codon:yes gene_type:complete
MAETSLRPKFKKGDLVRWFEYYAEGDIVRDAGKGIITEVNASRVFKKYDHITYEVYRAEYGNTALYAERELDPLIPGK